LCDVGDLNLRIGLDDLSQVVLEERTVEEVEMPTDNIVIEQFVLINLFAALKSEQVLLLVCLGDLLHGLYISALVFQGYS